MTDAGFIIVFFFLLGTFSVPQIFGEFLLGNPKPTKQPPQSSSQGNPFVRVNGSVADLVERPTREAQDEQYSDTVLASEGCRSSTEKEPKPKRLSPDIFRWGRGLPREGVGAKKFGMFLETREIKLFGRDIPGFWPGYPGGARKV